MLFSVQPAVYVVQCAVCSVQFAATELNRIFGPKWINSVIKVEKGCGKEENVKRAAGHPW